MTKYYLCKHCKTVFKDNPENTTPFCSNCNKPFIRYYDKFVSNNLSTQKINDANQNNSTKIINQQSSELYFSKSKRMPNPQKLRISLRSLYLLAIFIPAVLVTIYQIIGGIFNPDSAHDLPVFIVLFIWLIMSHAINMHTLKSNNNYSSKDIYYMALFLTIQIAIIIWCIFLYALLRELAGPRDAAINLEMLIIYSEIIISPVLSWRIMKTVNEKSQFIIHHPIISFSGIFLIAGVNFALFLITGIVSVYVQQPFEILSSTNTGIIGWYFFWFVLLIPMFISFLMGTYVFKKDLFWSLYFGVFIWFGLAAFIPILFLAIAVSI